MAAEVQTPLCRGLGINYPVFNAGIGAAAGPDLVAAVSNTGGFGVLGARAFPPDPLRQLVARTRALTNRPIGINLIIDERDMAAEDKAELDEQVRAAIGERPTAVVLFWGDPAAYIDEAHRQGVKLFIQVGSLDEARRAAAAGVDAVIAQGVEAGGHVRGTTSIWQLLPEVVDAMQPIPVMASGAIGDGAGLARALRS